MNAGCRSYRTSGDIARNWRKNSSSKAERKGSYIPCDNIITSTVDFEVCDKHILEKALNELGYNTTRSGSSIYFRNENGESCSIGGGRLNINGGTEEQAEALATQVKAKFGEVAVKESAKRHGWTVKTDADGRVKQLIRRKK